MPRGTLLLRCKRRVCKRKAFFRQPNINVHMYRRHILDTLGKHIRWKDTLEIVRTLQSQSRCKKKRTTKSEQNLLTIEIATPIAISIIQRQSRGQKWEKLERLRCRHLRLAIARKPIPRTT